MVFSLIILVLLGAIAFFHYVQGLFSATLSAILVILAAVLAVSYTEPLVDAFFAKGKFVDYAFGLVLIVLFSAIYLVLRLIFDGAVPGNVRLPVLMDKIGAGAMGVVAGIFATGVFAVAAESLPFAESFGMYSLYPIKDSGRLVSMRITGKTRDQDATPGVELDVSTLEETDKRSPTLLPVADAVLGLTQHLSDGGSLAGSRELASVHPDLLQELYGQRLGQQVGDKRIATAEQISVVDVFALDPQARLRQHSSEIGTVRKIEQPERTAAAGKRFVVVRVEVDHSATGSGDVFRFSTGAVNLVAGLGQPGDREWKNYYPVGTLDNGNFLFVSHPEDPLFLKPSSGSMIDFVFEVEAGALLANAGADADPKVRPGTHITIKRMARLDLSGKTALPTVTPDENVKVLRKPAVLASAGMPVPETRRR